MLGDGHSALQAAICSNAFRTTESVAVQHSTILPYDTVACLKPAERASQCRRAELSSAAQRDERSARHAATFIQILLDRSLPYVASLVITLNKLDGSSVAEIQC